MAKLPLDLERLIFETAVDGADDETTLNILLVARYVREWIRPIQYRIVVGTNSYTSPDVFSFTPPIEDIEEVGPFVHHLLLNGISADQCKVLKACPNIQDLALWTGPHTPSTLKWLQRLPLRRFSAYLTGLTPEDYKGPGFSNITHLDVAQKEDLTLDSLTALAYLPRLTHICLNRYVEVEAILRLLDQCARLHLLIILSPSRLEDYDGTDDQRAACLTTDDLRFVMIDDDSDDYYYTQGWRDTAHREFDLWDFAAQVHKARSEKYFIDNSQRQVLWNFKWAAELNETGLKWYKENNILPLSSVF